MACASSASIDQPAHDGGLVGHAGLRQPAVGVEQPVDPQAEKIVDQRVARPGIAGDQRVAVDVGHVGDAADIENRDRLIVAEPPHERAHPRRNAEPRRKHAVVADLDGQSAFAPTQQALSVEPHHGHFAWLDAVSACRGCRNFPCRSVALAAAVAGARARPSNRSGKPSARSGLMTRIVPLLPRPPKT
jgi:hypothetical protein